MPQAVFHILELATGELTSLENVRSFQTPEKNGDWVACLLNKPEMALELKPQKTAASETYEVTPQGLQRPKKSLKLKKRSTPEPQEAATKKPAAKKTKTPKATKENATEEQVVQENGEAGKTKPKTAKKSEKKKKKKRGTPLTLINLNTGVQRTYPNVVSFVFSKHGDAIAFSTSVETENANPPQDKSEAGTNPKSDSKGNSASHPNKLTDGVFVIRLGSISKNNSLAKIQLASGIGNYKNLAFSDDGKQLAFITDKDDYAADASTWSVYHWKDRSKLAKKIATEGGEGIPAGWWVSPNSSQFFSENGKRLFFDTAPVPQSVQTKREANSKNKDKEDDKPEVAKLDIWHWQDPQLQPQQLLLAKRERERDYRAVYSVRRRKVIQLATREIPNVAIDPRRDANLAVGTTDLPYRKMMSWDLPGFKDAYLVNLDTGQRKQLLSRVKWNARMSPEGKYLVWFDGDEQAWFSKSTAKPADDPIEISEGIEFPLYDELHDTPNVAGAYGSAGWLEDDKAILVYDRYDIWQLDPRGEASPVCLTAGKGREAEITFRYQRLDREARSIDPENPLMLRAFDNQTKASGYWRLAMRDGKENETPEENETAEKDERLKKLIMLDESLNGLQKAEASDRLLFTRSTFQMCPDLWHSDSGFNKIHRLSDMNPQQEEFTWGSAEIVQWKSANEDPLKGILYKPTGFDANKKHPLMVYFYERNSDNLHRYYTPEAGRSIINFSFYVSRGYLVFVPDIPYETGDPGQSAADAILPGVQALIDQGFVDKERIGMQGHSWGGYQTAFLVTQTDMFACAESGAPVSNMTSAYGGIRWGTGMSRMFQYERTQSRIGEDLWSARQKYIENSPIFFADRINTPLLILHNDQDGAVPWYQGIELFVALRRLEKPAWMLNYNGNPHWVMGDVNRRDFAIRMQQFFDHYLQNAPEPEWMAVGVPAVKKGSEMGLELLEPQEPASKSSSQEGESNADALRN